MATEAQAQFSKVSHSHQSISLRARSRDGCLSLHGHRAKCSGLQWGPESRAAGWAGALMSSPLGTHRPSLSRSLVAPWSPFTHGFPAYHGGQGGLAGREPEAASPKVSTSSWVQPWRLFPPFPLPPLCLWKLPLTVALSPHCVCPSPEGAAARLSWVSPSKVLIPETRWDPWIHTSNKHTAPQRTALCVTLVRTASKGGRALEQLLLSVLQSFLRQRKTKPWTCLSWGGCGMMWAQRGEQTN